VANSTIDAMLALRASCRYATQTGAVWASAPVKAFDLEGESPSQANVTGL